MPCSSALRVGVTPSLDLPLRAAPIGPITGSEWRRGRAHGALKTDWSDVLVSDLKASYSPDDHREQNEDQLLVIF